MDKKAAFSTLTMPWRNLDLWITLSLIVSEVFPVCLFVCLFVQANGILHRALIDATNVFGMTRLCRKKTNKRH
jgi:hypothetical protein